MNEQKPLVFFFFLSLSPRGTGQTWVSEMEKSGSAKTQGINEWFGRDQRKSTGKKRPKGRGKLRDSLFPELGDVGRDAQQRPQNETGRSPPPHMGHSVRNTSLPQV